MTGDITQRTAVEAAARSTEDILSTTYTNYDDQIDEATTKMTDTFAAEYRETSDGIKDKFIANRTKLQYKVVAQGVVRASSSQAQALLFLNQYVEQPGGRQAGHERRAVPRAGHRGPHGPGVAGLRHRDAVGFAKTRTGYS